MTDFADNQYVGDIVCAMCQVVEPPDLWTRNLRGTVFADEAPHLERDPLRGDTWIDGAGRHLLANVVDVGALCVDRSRPIRTWRDVPNGATNAAEFARSLHLDGVEHAVVYPSLALPRARENLWVQPRLEAACARIYNDWLIDEWVHTNPMFVPLCILPVGPIEAVIAEARRCIDKGYKGVVFPSSPMLLGKLPHINDDYYFPLWDLCSSASVPVSFLAGDTQYTQLPPFDETPERVAGALRAVTGPASGIHVLANFLFSPIPKKFPNLRVVFAGSSLGWAAYILETAEHQFERQRLNQEGYTSSMAEVFRRQCYLMGWYDRDAISLIDVIGQGNVMWCTAFPAATSTWPTTRVTVGEWSQHVSADACADILRNNASNLYALN